MNLDRIFSFFRFPGHRHTESIVAPMIKNGFRIMDGGAIYDHANYFGRIFREGGFVWHTNTVTGFDELEPEFNDRLKLNLDRGMFSLIISHFILISDRSPDYILFLTGLYDWLEGCYPHLRWLTGEEQADFWDELSEVRVGEQTCAGDNVRLDWRGANSTGQTIIAHLPDSTMTPKFCEVDGLSAAYEKRDRRLFVKLPRLADGEHALQIHLAPRRQADGSQTSPFQVETASDRFIYVSHYFSQPAELKASLYDVQGRLAEAFPLMYTSAGRQRLAFPLDGSLGSGAYFLSIQCEGKTYHRMLSIRK